MECPFNYEPNGESVLIDPFSCDLNLIVDSDCLLAYPMSDEGFNMIWAGCRSNYGVNTSKILFEVHLTDNCECVSLPKDDSDPYSIRVGWSLINTSLQLGENKFSFAFCSNGKKMSDNQIEDYGESFKAGDSIAAYIDFESDPKKIIFSFSKNGIDLGTAYIIDKNDLETFYNSEFTVKLSETRHDVFFPHVLSKNIVFEMNYGQRVSVIGEEPFAPIKTEFSFIQKIPIEQRFCSDTILKHRKNSEILMMVGLPGSGKTEWALNYTKTNPEHSYYVIGVSSLISKLSVKAINSDLLEKMLKCMNVMLDVGSQTTRNYIIDQSNVYASTRRRKMKMFEKFQTRKAIVLIQTYDVYKEEKFPLVLNQQINKETFTELVHDMKSDFSLPTIGESFDSIEYIELGEEEAKSLIEIYNKEGKDNRFNTIVGKRKIVKTNCESLLNNVTNLSAPGFIRPGTRPIGYQQIGNRFNQANKRMPSYYGNQVRFNVNRYPGIIPGTIVTNPYLTQQPIMIGTLPTSQWPGVNYATPVWTQPQQPQSQPVSNNWAPALPISNTMPVHHSQHQTVFGILPNSNESYRYSNPNNPNQGF